MGTESLVSEAEGIQPKVTNKAVIVMVIITPDNPKNQFFRSPIIPKADAATKMVKSANALSGAIMLGGYELEVINKSKSVNFKPNLLLKYSLVSEPLKV